MSSISSIKFLTPASHSSEGFWDCSDLNTLISESLPNSANTHGYLSGASGRTNQGIASLASGECSYLSGGSDVCEEVGGDDVTLRGEDDDDQPTPATMKTAEAKTDEGDHPRRQRGRVRGE